MKIKVEIDESFNDIEITIKTNKIDETIINLQQLLQSEPINRLNVYKKDSEYFIWITDILFIETNSNKVYVHSNEDIYETKEKLYQLELTLPTYFCRVSKSVIVNSAKIHSLERSFSGTNTISFRDSAKKTYVSRHYYKLLKDKIIEKRSNNEK